AELHWRDTFRRIVVLVALSLDTATPPARLRAVCRRQRSHGERSAALRVGTVVDLALSLAERSLLRREPVARRQEGVRELRLVAHRDDGLLRRVHRRARADDYRRDLAGNAHLSRRLVPTEP